MLKNDLLKNDGEIIRIITIKNNYALVINCIKRNMPYWINIELLESYIPCNDQELLIISHKTLYNIDELDARSQSIIYFRYGIIEPLIYEIDNKKKRNILIKNISIQNNISGQTLRKYLCDYLAFQDKTILAPKKNISNKTLSKDEKNMRWALNKFFYTKRKNSLYTAYLFMLKEKYTINDKLQESHPSFYQFRYFYRKTKKLQTYYISRNGIKDYQKNHRPLLGNGIKEFAPTIGTGMLDSTICDIYLINTDGNIIGRPILTVCIDAYCGLCYGYNLSWKGGIYSISGLMESIVSDKHLLCEKFGINIGEHEWINKSIPGTMVTDKGTEYISASFEKFISLGWLNSIKSIYHLSDYKGKMYSLEGFGKKSVDKLLESIEKSRKTTLDRFIYALSVPMIGKSASKDIAKHFKYNFEEFYHCFSCGYGYFWNLKVDGIGVVASNNIQKFAITYMDKVFELSKEFTFKIPSESNNAQNTLQGKTFVITGSLEKYSNRDELKSVIESYGGKVSGSVSAKTFALINNDIESSSSKNKKAKSLGVQIINEEQFMQLIGE